MIRSLSRRFVYAILLLWIISIIAFWLSKQVPGDEVEDYLSIDDRTYSAIINPVDHRTSYQRVAKNRGLDLPLFYFSISPGYYPDSLFRIFPYDDQAAVKNWIRHSHSGKESIELHHRLANNLMDVCHAASEINSDQQLCMFYHQALSTSDLKVLHQNGTALLETIRTDSTIRQQGKNDLLSVIEQSEKLLRTENSRAAYNWLPAFRWHGANNQYHQWMAGLLLQKPLTSLVDGRDAWAKIYDALKWTLLMNGFALLLALILGILIGIWSGTHDGRTSERQINWLLFALFAIPSFWLGTLFIYFFSSGEWFRLFPAGGLGSYHTANTILERWSIIGYHLVLPVLCLALGSIAYISRQMKQSIQHEFYQPYVRALRLQGISEKTILRKHVIRNALFPIITLAGGSIPVLISGSLIIEVIFSIPGMGRLMYTSLLSRDWPVAFPILMFGAVVTVFSYILTDIIYRWADPRVKTTLP